MLRFLMFNYGTLNINVDLYNNYLFTLLNNYNKLKFKLFSTSSIQVLAKIEGGSAVEKWSDFSTANTWQEFSYDFSDSVTNGNTKLVLFFNAGQSNGSIQDTYLIDELRWEEN